jgi:hypothetical protein
MLNFLLTKLRRIRRGVPQNLLNGAAGEEWCEPVILRDQPG